MSDMINSGPYNSSTLERFDDTITINETLPWGVQSGAYNYIVGRLRILKYRLGLKSSKYEIDHELFKVDYDHQYPKGIKSLRGVVLLLQSILKFMIVVMGIASLLVYLKAPQYNFLWIPASLLLAYLLLKVLDLFYPKKLRHYHIFNRKTGEVTLINNRKKAFKASFIKVDPGFTVVGVDLLDMRLYFNKNLLTSEDYQRNHASTDDDYHGDLFKLWGATRYCGSFVMWEFLQDFMDISKPLPDIPELEPYRHLDPITKAYDEKKSRDPEYWKNVSISKEWFPIRDALDKLVHSYVPDPSKCIKYHRSKNDLIGPQAVMHYVEKYVKKNGNPDKYHVWFN
ncbi:hypothetical protein KCM76_18330 [Zooshikella marina]|uniref:hypothetical protein n=1 Tax=Zooshikella ganghwensis TaxID=202772 RepID=UPI001BB01A1D|nr:hypothetical protein [Zooshikella ganghwensis]MBU2707959.1 hypothetical protein [Zooshikella ganghwensis]